MITKCSGKGISEDQIRTTLTELFDTDKSPTLKSLTTIKTAAANSLRYWGGRMTEALGKVVQFFPEETPAVTVFSQMHTVAGLPRAVAEHAEYVKKYVTAKKECDVATIKHIYWTKFVEMKEQEDLENKQTARRATLE
jgi:hypothetical protein